MESTDNTGQSQEPTTPTKTDESSSSSTQVTLSSPQKAATPSATFVVASSSPAVSANTVGVTLNMSSASNPTSLVPTIGSNSIAVSMAQQQQQALQYVQLVQSHNNGIPFYQPSQQLQLQPSIVHLQSFPSINTIPIMSQTTAQTAIPVGKPGRPQMTGQLPIRPTPTASTASSRAMLPTQAFPQQAVVVNTMGSQQQTLALGNQLFTVNKTQKNLVSVNGHLFVNHTNTLSVFAIRFNQDLPLLPFQRRDSFLGVERLHKSSHNSHLSLPCFNQTSKHLILN